MTGGPSRCLSADQRPALPGETAVAQISERALSRAAVGAHPPASGPLRRDAAWPALDDVAKRTAREPGLARADAVRGSRDHAWAGAAVLGRPGRFPCGTCTRRARDWPRSGGGWGGGLRDRGQRVGRLAEPVEVHGAGGDSDGWWIASPSRPTEPVITARSSSMTPVAARPAALTAPARRSCASSRTLGRGNAAAGSRTPEVLCISQHDRAAARPADPAGPREGERPQAR